MARRWGAVETGGTTIRCAWSAAPPAARDVVTLPTGDDPVAVVDRVRDYFAAHPVEAIGIAAFGPLEVDPASPRWGTLLATPKPGWSGFPLGPSVQRATGADVVLDTDVNAAALAEWTQGRAGWGRPGAGTDGDGPLVYVTVGTGVGMGAVVGGATLRGLLHPEAGHLRIRRDPGDDWPGACPFHGDCLEGLACGPALAARWGRPAQELAPGHEAWDLAATHLARGLAAMTLVLSPRTIVLGGGVGANAFLREAVAQRLPGELAGSLDRSPQLRAPALADSGLVGALALAAAAAADT